MHSLATAAKTGSAATRADFKWGTGAQDALGARCHLSREAPLETLRGCRRRCRFAPVGVGVGVVILNPPAMAWSLECGPLC